MKLYELTAELSLIEELLERHAEENEGDFSEFPLLEEFDKLMLSKEDKILSMGVWVKNLLAESKAIGEEKTSLAAREKANKTKADSIKGYLQSQLEAGVKYENAQCKISWRKSENVIIGCLPEELEEEFCEVTYKANKTAIKASIKAGGKAVEFAEIVKKQNLQIK